MQISRVELMDRLRQNVEEPFFKAPEGKLIKPDVFVTKAAAETRDASRRASFFHSFYFQNLRSSKVTERFKNRKPFPFFIHCWYLFDAQYTKDAYVRKSKYVN